MAKTATDPWDAFSCLMKFIYVLKKSVVWGHVVSNITFAADQKWSHQQIYSSQEISNSLTWSDDLELNQILKSNLL